MARNRYRTRRIDLDEVISDTLSGSEFDAVESPISKNVFHWVIFGTIAVLIIVFFRVSFMAGVKGAAYKMRSQDNVHQTIPLVAPRGVITDRYGKPLVKNEPIFSVFLHVDQMIKNGEQETVLETAKNTLGVDEEKVLSLIQGTNLEGVSDIIIAADVTREQVIAIGSLGLKSLNVEQSFKREYISPAFSHVVGYVGLASEEDLNQNQSLVLNDFTGRSGLEAYYDDRLRGENGRVTVFSDSSGDIGEIMRTREPVPGKELKTTIDAELQE